MKLVLFLAASILVGQTGCSTVPDRGLTVSRDSASGWFQSDGEWTIYGRPGDVFRSRQVLAAPPECINLINATGLDRRSFDRLNGDYVSVQGERVPFSALETPGGPAGPFQHHSLWNGEVVLNSCLNEDVFIAREIELSRPKQRSPSGR
jgi:hypothetical protein